jgi:hypothetical protein
VADVSAAERRATGAQDGRAISDREWKLEAVRAVMLRAGLDESAQRPEIVYAIIDAVEAPAWAGSDRRLADRRDPEAYREMMGNPLWKADAEANKREYERRQGERRQGDRRRSVREGEADTG